MLYSVAVMAFAGSICVGNMPLIPTWIGSMAGAAAFAFVTTLKSAKVRFFVFIPRKTFCAVSIISIFRGFFSLDLPMTYGLCYLILYFT